jgi:flagellar biosynthetic protein FlhB
MSSSAERSEKPTPKKIKDARKKGQLVRSRDLAVAAASVVSTLALARFGGRLMDGMGERLASALTHLGDAPLRTITAGDITGMVASGSLALALLVGPIAIATMVATLAAQGAQGGWNVSSEALNFNWSRLNPKSGLKRLAPSQSGVDTLKMALTVTVITWLAWGTIHTAIDDGPRMAWLTPEGAAVVAWTHAESLLWQVAWALVILAIGDYGLQRYRLMSQLKMSVQEVRDEGKQSEGNPEIKGRIRRIQRDMARRRMISDVANATVVITNPTHYAVALQYRRGVMAAPLVLAKGCDHLAAAIREQARKHGIPIVEDKPLAQGLFKAAEVGEPIPVALFAAVAEVLAQLIRLKQLAL